MKKKIITKNGRIYTESIYSDEIIKYFNDKITTDFYGELEHKTNISHQIMKVNVYKRLPRKLKKKYKKLGIYESYINNLIVSIKALNNDSGEIVKKFDNFNNHHGALRSLGTVDKDGLVTIDKIISFDITN